MAKRGAIDPEGDLRVSTHAVAELSSQALISNFRAIREMAGGQSLVPMVKANAYGHGAEWVLQTLRSETGIFGFGVATLEEGAAARQSLGVKGRKHQVLVFSGTLPWTEEKGNYCEEHHLTPVIASEEDWRIFFKAGWPSRIAYQLKFNTGMNRLGIPVYYASKIKKDLREQPASWHPQGIFSHLAIGEQPQVALSRLQRERFEHIRSELSGVLPSALFHLANSSGIWNQKLWRLEGLTDLVRPGLSLYGIPPWAGAPLRGIHPVMTVRAPVVMIHTLKPGESVGYGATYRVTGSAAEKIAILGVGYGDGLHRTLSGASKGEGPGQGGWVSLGLRLEPVLGLVSMDLCAVRCGASVKVGDWAEIMGPSLDPWAQAQAAKTIPYELLTSVSSRVQRIYG